MEKRGKKEEGLYEEWKEERCEFEDLILGVLIINIDYGINNELREKAKAEGERGRKKEGKEGGEEKEEEEKGGEGMGELIKYLKEVKKWDKLKVFRVVKEAWWIIKK